MKNRYRELRERHQIEFNKFPIKYASSDDKLETVLKEFGLKKSDKHKLVSIGIGGGIIRESDVDDFLKLIRRHKEELKEAIDSDETGEGFIKEMFIYELGCHEYCLTREFDETLEACRINNGTNKQ